LRYGQNGFSVRRHVPETPFTFPGRDFLIAHVPELSGSAAEDILEAGFHESSLSLRRMLREFSIEISADRVITPNRDKCGIPISVPLPKPPLSAHFSPIMKTCFLCGAGDEIDRLLLRRESAASADIVRFHEKCFSALEEKIREVELIFCIDKKPDVRKFYMARLGRN
jgi:hypothetical protein